MKTYRLLLSPLFILVFAHFAYALGDGDVVSDTAAVRPNHGIINRIINYFSESNKKPIGRKMDFSLIGGPFYSSDSKFGIGIVAAGAYSTAPDDSLTCPSDMALSFKATTAVHFELSLEGVHVFPHDRYRLDYNVSFSSIDTKYWGIGYEMCSNNSNESKYKYLASHAEALFAIRFGKNIYMGPLMTFDYVNARAFHKPELWYGLPHRTFNYGIGASLRYDTRDNLTATKKGVLIRFDQTFDFGWMGNKYPFKINECTVAWFQPVWKGCTLASRLHWRITWGETPWGLMSYLGGSETMRGYFEGRYRDKGAADLCVELRQHVWRRNGVVAWAGVGSIFPRITSIHFNRLLPNFGFGYRWEFKRNVNVRVDIGFGKHERGLFFGINEAF